MGDVGRFDLQEGQVDNGLLIAVNPAGQGDDQKVKGLYEERHCGMRVFVISFEINIIQIVRIISPYGQQPQPKTLPSVSVSVDKIFPSL